MQPVGRQLDGTPSGNKPPLGEPGAEFELEMMELPGNDDAPHPPH